jgi:hypothetical protein
MGYQKCETEKVYLSEKLFCGAVIFAE